jgi:hypothetical protein
MQNLCGQSAQTGLNFAAIAADPALEHDPEKCEAVFRKDHAQTTT